MRFPRLLTSLLIAAGVAACVPMEPTTRVTSGGGPDIASAQAEAYDGPKARIAVADFEDKMSSKGYYRDEYGRGMSDMLTTELFNTDRYIVLERQKLRAVMAEQDLGATGRIKRETAAEIGEIEGAELLVTAAITGFDPGVSGTNVGLGGVLGGALGGVLGGVKTSRVAMDLRVIDTRTGRIVAATSVEANATSFSAGVGGIGSSMVGGLSTFAKTPMETAIRKAIHEAVQFVVQRTPRTYYRYR